MTTERITKSRHKIITFVSYYLPGCNGGGPIRTIANMVEHLSDEFEFWIITRDRDLGDNVPYPRITINEWQSVGKAMVYYQSPETSTMLRVASLISATPHDLLYLNSFFDPFGTIRPLLAKQFGLLPSKPGVVAPRGEFSAGALKLKYLKKLMYIKLARVFGLYNNLIWQASSEYEAQDIVKVMRVNPADIHVAIDLPALPLVDPHSPSTLQVYSEDTSLRVIFLSRISPMKNLAYAIRVLKLVTARITFDVYGPAEDTSYWRQCQGLIKQLPENIMVKYYGTVAANQVRRVLSGYDLFFLPTRGENYCHVIVESLSVGTPVLISDQTPWRNLAIDEMGWDLPLANEEEFAEKINEYAILSQSEKDARRDNIKKQIIMRLSKSGAIEANRELFRRAIAHKKEVCSTYVQ